MLTTSIKTNEGKNKRFRIGRSCCFGGWKHFSSDACMLFPSQCGFRCCSHWLGGTGIINSEAGCIYFKTLLRVCMGADGISLQS